MPDLTTPITRRSLLVVGGALLLTGCALRPAEQGWSERQVVPPSLTDPITPADAAPQIVDSNATQVATREQIVAEFTGRTPTEFGMAVPGVISEGHRDIVLTFDACGGPQGSGFDIELIDVLVRYHVPATLFLNVRWAHTHPMTAAELAANPLFEIASHGLEHRPLTVAGQSAYGIAGTAHPGAVYDEITRSRDALAEITGAPSPYFRPGTAWCDDVAVEIAHRLGVKVIGFSVNGDWGATASAHTVAATIGAAPDRSIVLAHFNHPGRGTAAGLAQALPRLLGEGRKFSTLTGGLAVPAQ